LGDDEDTRLLIEMAQQAKDYLSSFALCGSIREAYFGDGYGGIAAIFFFHIQPMRPEVDEWLWVVVGDLPPAYLVSNIGLSSFLYLPPCVLTSLIRLAARVEPRRLK